MVIAARRTDLIEEVASEIVKGGGQALAVTVDVSVEEDLQQLAGKALDAYGRIDVWINNVGVGAIGYFWEIPPEVHARVVDVNLKGLIYGSHVALNQFIKQDGGTLVNVGSIDSEVPLALQNTYAATKAAVLSLSRSINEELRLSELGNIIKVATIMPWAVDTPWWDHAANYTGHAARMAAMDDPEIVVDAIVKACTEPREEMPVGPKAGLANISHRLMPDLTEKMSGALSKRESEKGSPRPVTSGTLFKPMAEGRGVDGGIRARMASEDA